MAAAWTDEEPDFDDTDRSLEEMGDGPEGQHEPDEEADEVAAAGEPPKKPEGEEPDEEPEGDEPEEPPPVEEPQELKGLPANLRAALLAERKARQAAEAAARAADERYRADLAARDAQFRLLQSQQQPPEQPAAPLKPDPVLDPEGYERYMMAALEQRYTVRRIEETFAAQHEALGKDFETAYVELQKLNPNNPVDKATGHRIYTSPDPGKALMKWHREQTALREMGGDPAAYRQRLRDELVNDPDMVKAVLARLREQGEEGRPGAPRNITRLPPSLARARGGSSAKEVLSAADNTDEAVFDYAMNGNA